MIRKITDTDIDSVMTIWLSSNIDSHFFIPKQYWQGNYDSVKSALPDAEVYVYLEDTGKILGFIGLQENYIAGLFVDKVYRSHGVGKALLDYVKSIKQNLSLKVYDKNKGALRFYTREGFVCESTDIDEETNEKELLMRYDSKNEFHQKIK